MPLLHASRTFVAAIDRVRSSSMMQAFLPLVYFSSSSAFSGRDQMNPDFPNLLNVL
jgi:hypothetical protein